MSPVSLSGAGVESVAAAIAGPPTVVEPIDIGRYAADLKRRALLLTNGDLSRASDIVQDTFERALLARHRIAPGSNVRAWLYTILAHRFHDLLRYERVRKTAEYTDDLAPAVETQEAPRWYAVTTEQVRTAVEKLEPDLRLVFERREFGRLSYRRIAEELNVPVVTVGTRLLRARLRLRELLALELEAGER